MGKTRSQASQRSVRASQENRIATLEVEPSSLSELVRLVLKRIGDPNAKAPEVKRKALEWFPTWKKEIAGAKHWSSFVTQNRDRVAEELGIERRVMTGGGGSPSRGTLAFSDYEAASELVSRFCDDDLERASELLDFIYGKNTTRLRVALMAWRELVESVGSPEAAMKALEAMSKTGGVINR